MSKIFNISTSPHIRKDISTQSIMGDVLIALIPVCLFGIYNFGLSALRVIVASVASCVVSEILFQFFTNRKVTVSDLSAAVTGVLLALSLPVDVGIGQAVFGCVCAIVVIKQFFGGIGQNFINPALGARIIMLVSFPDSMTTYTYDGITTATPLSGGEADTLDLWLGTMGGSLGETCAVALIIGGIALICFGIIRPVIPAFYIGTVALMSLACGENAVLQILSGGLLLAAFFMATDYTTSPLTDTGKAIYAIGCGILTCVIRFYANLPEGVSYAIVLMNILTPLIDRIVPRYFGKQKKEAKG